MLVVIGENRFSVWCIIYFYLMYFLNGGFVLYIWKFFVFYVFLYFVGIYIVVVYMINDVIWILFII